MYSILEKDIVALIVAGKQEALASTPTSAASAGGGLASASTVPYVPSVTVPSAGDLRKVFFTASTFRPDRAWPLTLGASNRLDCHMPRDTWSASLHLSHHVDDNLFNELLQHVTVTLEMALDPKLTETLFVKVATARAALIDHAPYLRFSQRMSSGTLRSWVTPTI